MLTQIQEEVPPHLRTETGEKVYISLCPRTVFEVQSPTFARPQFLKRFLFGVTLKAP